jgi:hypothetical protein
MHFGQTESAQKGYRKGPFPASLWYGSGLTSSTRAASNETLAGSSGIARQDQEEKK